MGYAIKSNVIFIINRNTQINQIKTGYVLKKILKQILLLKLE